MIRLDSHEMQLVEVTPPAKPAEPATVCSNPVQGELPLEGETIQKRPEVVEALTYKMRSSFVNHNVYITLGWVIQGGVKRPIEIFFNTKDLTRSQEYVMLTRLISALFRRCGDPSFILEELRGIQDPNGGRFREGRYVQSLYAEVAEVIERFFYDVGIMQPKVGEYAAEEGEKVVSIEFGGNTPRPEINAEFKICPDCQQKTLKMENGCDSCMACGYSKCDK